MNSYILSSVFLTFYFIILSEGSPNPSSLSLFRDSYNPRKCRDCICGVKKAVRIVGGELADRRDFPWLVQLKKKGYKLCGGSLITRRHVLTAAHCVHNELTSHITVDFGEGERILRSIRVHRAYNPKSMNNDIAILELYMPVKLSSKIRTICLPERNVDFDGKTGISTGWGARFEGDKFNTQLRTVKLPILSKSQCSKSFYTPGRLTDNMFCAGYLTGGKDTCQGDSGGPLEVHEAGASTVLAGVVSWGAGCAKYGYPGVYTKVSNYIDWIETYTYNECLCPSLEH